MILNFFLVSRPRFSCFLVILMISLLFTGISYYIFYTFYSKPLKGTQPSVSSENRIDHSKLQYHDMKLKLSVTTTFPVSRKFISPKTISKRHSSDLPKEIEIIISKSVASVQELTAIIRRNLSNGSRCEPCKNSSFHVCHSCNSSHHLLLGNLPMYFNKSISLDQVMKSNPNVKLGAFSPEKCNPQTSVAVVIPFRDRWLQLTALLSVLHPMLQRQQLCYRVFVVEQKGTQAFNKGKLNNAGFIEASKLYNFDCVVFQDADVIPAHDYNMYTCSRSKPRHLAAALDIHKFKLPYPTLVGGVIAFTVEQYIGLNGYSNLYWGWGLEDDDIEIRMKSNGRPRYERPNINVARYWLMNHTKQHIYKVQASRRKPLLSTVSKRMMKDGVNSVKYEVVNIAEKRLFTHITVDIGPHPAEFDDN